jgi:hypothetical protein
MNIDRSRIVELLRQRKLDTRANWVERTLPATIDISKNAGLLATLNIDPAELMDQKP